MNAKRMNLLIKIALVLSLVAISAGLYFANKKLTTLASNTSQLKADVEVSEKQIINYEITKEKVTKLSYVNELAAQVLPAQEDQSTVVAELNLFARQTVLSISKIEFVQPGSSGSGKKPATPAGVNVTPVNIEIAEGASYSNLLKFLNLLETNRRRSQVSNISISPDDENINRLNQVTISLNLYTKKATGN